MGAQNAITVACLCFVVNELVKTNTQLSWGVFLREFDFRHVGKRGVRYMGKTSRWSGTSSSSFLASSSNAERHSSFSSERSRS